MKSNWFGIVGILKRTQKGHKIHKIGEKFNQNITKHKKKAPKFSKMFPKNALKQCNLAEIGGYELI